ncbi:hypothetical protein HPB50_029374 [Hyalomma asiaticum]|nr:hypothetical protein HPB50_029374 [Hyalomma asiaticum]
MGKGVRWRLTEASGATPILPVLVFTFSVISLAKGLKISPKSCENAIGERGTCMFVWECIKLDGKHLGTCTDGFLYGSCCEYDDSENSVAGGLAPEPPSSSPTTTSTETPPSSPPQPQPQKQRPKPPQHAKPPPGKPGVTTSLNSIAVPSYPQRNFTLIYLTPTSPTPTMTKRPSTTTRRTYRPSTQPSTASSPPSTRRPAVTSTTTAAPSTTPTVNSVVVTATRWPPTFRPPGITTFWSLFRPRPTLVPIITFRPSRRPPTRPPTTTRRTTTKTTTTTTTTTKKPARPPSPQRPQRPQRPQHGTHGRPTTTRKPPATSAAQTGSASTPVGSKRPVPPSQLLNKRPKGLKISPKSCENAIGERGTCMFVWECIKLDGKHLGTCTDGFLYGSCCEYDDSENSVAGGLAPEPPSSSPTTTSTETPPSSPPQPQPQKAASQPPQHAKPPPGKPV